MRQLTEQEVALQNKIKDVHDELNKLFPKIKDATAEFTIYCRDTPCSDCVFQIDDCGNIYKTLECTAYVLKMLKELIK